MIMEIKVCKLKEIITITGNVLTVGSDTIEPILPKYGKEGKTGKNTRQAKINWNVGVEVK